MKLPPKRHILTASEAKSKPVDDTALFNKEMASVTPLKHEITHRESTTIEPLPRPKRSAESNAVDSHYSEQFELKTVGNEEILSFQRSGVQDRLFKQLRAGQISLDAELDLHGMTTPIAHQQLAYFIRQCRLEHIRCVRIIHGKGWGSKDNQPVLKTKLNAWLQQEDNVLAFCSTPIEYGGAGAVFVLLRRQLKS